MEIFNAVNSVNNAQQPIKQLHNEVEHSGIAKGELDAQKRDETKNIENNSQANDVKKEADKNEIKKELEEITKQLNEEMNVLNTTIRFGFNDKIDEMYVSVIDTKDDKVIRKIPSDEAMKLMAKMRELVGMLFDEKG